MSAAVRAANSFAGTQAAAVLRAVAASGDESQTSALLREGATPDAITSALGAAADNGHVGVVRQLLNAGGRVTEDALHGAARAGNIELLEALCSEGASADALTDALGYAFQYEQEDAARWLIARGALLHDDGDHTGCAVQYAAVFGHETMLAELLSEADDPMGTCAVRCLVAAMVRGVLDCAALLAARFGRMPHTAALVKRTVGLHRFAEAPAELVFKILAGAYEPHEMVALMCTMALTTGRTDLVEWAMQWLRAVPGRILRVNLITTAAFWTLPMRACGALLDSMPPPDEVFYFTPLTGKQPLAEQSPPTTALLLRRVCGYAQSLEFGVDWRGWKDIAILGSLAVQKPIGPLSLFRGQRCDWWLDALLMTSFNEHPESVADLAYEQAPAALLDCERSWFTACGAAALLPELAAFHYRYTHSHELDVTRKGAIPVQDLPTDDDGMSAEDHAVERGYCVNFTHVLLAYDRTSRELAWLLLAACSHGNLSLARFLVAQAGVDCDGRIDDGDVFASDVSPIHVAACNKQRRAGLLRLLLEHGADPAVEARLEQSDEVQYGVVCYSRICRARLGDSQPLTALDMCIARNGRAAARLLAEAAAWRRRRHMLALRQRWLQSDAMVFSAATDANAIAASTPQQGAVAVDVHPASPLTGAPTVADVGSPLAMQLAHAALLGRYGQFMELLGDRGVMWTSDALGCTLACAAKAGLIVFVDSLVERGKAVDSGLPLPPQWMGRALMLAAARQHFDVMLVLHDAGATFECADTGAGSTVAALAEVCSNDAMEAAIYCGIDVNDADPATGALVYQPSSQGLMALLQAPTLDWSRAGALALVLRSCFQRVLLPRREPEAAIEATSVLSAALARGLDANSVITGEACTAAFGIAAGVGAADAWAGSTLLHVAVAGELDTFVQCLRIAGADASSPDSRGMCAWQLATRHGPQRTLCRAAAWSRRRHLLALRGEVADSCFGADDGDDDEGTAPAEGDGCRLS